MPTIEQIERLLGREPDDVFLNFGLAMALASAGRIDEALARFDRVVRLDADYLSAWFQKARVLEAQGRGEEARAALEKGIERARVVGDEHAAAEMTAFLEALGS